MDPEAAAGAGARVQAATVEADPFPHADQSLAPGPGPAGRWALAVVDHLDLDRGVAVADRDAGMGRPGVLILLALRYVASAAL